MRLLAWMILVLLIITIFAGIHYVPRHDGQTSLVIGMILAPSVAVCWCMYQIMPRPKKAEEPQQAPEEEKEAKGSPHVSNRWLVAITVTLATFMEVLDTSIANVALPYIAGDLGVSVDDASWVLTTYLVANAIVLPLSGWISNWIGRKRFYMFCVALFTISSALCGIAPNLTMLLLFRVLQGAGGGGLQPSEQGILIDTFPGKKRGMAMSIYGVAILVAPILGPTLGGYITENIDWRWIFFINVPVGILSLTLTGLLVHDPSYMDAQRKADKGKKRNIDFVGLGLIVIGLASLEIIYDRGQEDGWFNAHYLIVLFVLAIVGIGCAVIWELRHPDPIVNFGLLKERNFAASCVVIFVIFAVLYGSNVLLPQMTQALFGYDAYTAGLILSPGGLAVMVCMPISGLLMNKGVQSRYLILFGSFCIAAASLWSSDLNLNSSPTVLVIRRCAQLFGMAFIFAPVNTAAYSYLPKNQINNATGLYNMIRNEGSSLGIALVNILLARRSQFHQSRLTENLDTLNPAFTSYDATATAAFQSAGYDPVTAGRMSLQAIYDTVGAQALSLSYFDLFYVFAIGAFIATPLALLMRRSDPKKGAEAGVH